MTTPLQSLHPAWVSSCFSQPYCPTCGPSSSYLGDLLSSLCSSPSDGASASLPPPHMAAQPQDSSECPSAQPVPGAPSWTPDQKGRARPVPGEALGPRCCHQVKHEDNTYTPQQGFPRAAAPVGVFSRGTTRISGSLSCGAREVRSPCGQAPGTSPTLPQPAPSRARTLEAGERWARLAQARAASRPS